MSPNTQVWKNKQANTFTCLHVPTFEREKSHLFLSENKIKKKIDNSSAIGLLQHQSLAELWMVNKFVNDKANSTILFYHN